MIVKTIRLFSWAPPHLTTNQPTDVWKINGPPTDRPAHPPTNQPNKQQTNKPISQPNKPTNKIFLVEHFPWYELKWSLFHKDLLRLQLPVFNLEYWHSEDVQLICNTIKKSCKVCGARIVVGIELLNFIKLLSLKQILLKYIKKDYTFQLRK